MRLFQLCTATTLALALFAVSQSSAAKLYKWVDENGNVSYSQKKPPPGKKTEEVKIWGSGTTDEQARDTLDALKDKNKVASDDREAEESNENEKLTREEQLKKNCEIGRSNQRVFESGLRIKKDNGDLYSPEELAGRKKQNAELIKNSC